MKRVLSRVLGTALLTSAVSALIAAPETWADPANPDADPATPTSDVAPAAGPLPGPVTVASDGVGSVSDACTQFTVAINLAAANYEDFAYATAGNGNVVNYDDPEVARTNGNGRTALRQAAALAMDASRTPGLPPEVSDPMQSWSLHATKLVLIMGLRGGGDSLNNTASQLNTDANNANLACATSGRM